MTIRDQEVAIFYIWDPTVIAPISREPVEVSRIPQKSSLSGREFTRKRGRPASANPTSAKRPAPTIQRWDRHA